MTGRKRTRSASPEGSSPPRKAVSTGNDGNDSGDTGPSQQSFASQQPSSSQPVSSQIESSQLVVPTIEFPSSEPMSSQPESLQANVSNTSQLVSPSLPPGSSQVDVSFTTDKSLSEISEGERARWREFSDPREFFDFTGWNRDSLEHFLAGFGYFAQQGMSLPDWLLSEAQDSMNLLRSAFESKGLNTQINWNSIPYKPDTAMTESSADNLMYVWIQLKKFKYSFRAREHRDEFAKMLATMLPITKREEKKLWDKAMALAFHREEKLTSDGRRPSETVFRKLLQYYNDYNSQIHLSPYTSIVGPSGIGKSFATQQIAAQHNVYVVYASFARQNSNAYPRRSAIANTLPEYPIRQAMVEFWECYLTISLSEVRVCKEIGITPAGFYNLQTKESYRNYQMDFARQVGQFFERYKGQKGGVQSRMTQPRIRQLLLGHIERSQASLPMWRVELDENEDNPGQDLHQNHMQGIPDALICIDEARELIRDGESLSFRSLREALRNRFHRSDNHVDPSKPQRDFFAVLLDTTSKVGDFSPPAHFDRSQKGLNPLGIGQRLFPPIYSVDTMDIFCNNEDTQTQDGSLEAVVKLFSSARPLWGGRCDIEGVNSLEDQAVALKELAWQKTEGQGVYSALALLSYRSNFYVINDTLAEEMVGSCLRYIVYINEARDLLRTTQPSEPILAFVASERMKDPATRSKVIRQFVSSCFEGTINIGDVGEMIASLLFLFAYDEVQFRRNRAFPGPIPLARFMESMFGQQPEENMRERMVTDQEMKTLWETGQVFFNHFVRVENAPDATTLEKAFERGAALFLPNRFPGADILIPIKVPGSEMTFCLVQVKNRKRDRSTPGFRNTAISLLTEAVDELALSQNHIGVMMCLRHDPLPTDNDDDQFQILLPTTHTSRATRTTSTTSTFYKWPRNAKKLIVMAMGLDAELYPFVNTCIGQCTEESARILPLLRRLLDCIPGTSLPDDIEEAYVRRLVPLG